MDSINNARLNIIAEKADLRYTAFFSKKELKMTVKKANLAEQDFDLAHPINKLRELNKPKS